MTNRLFWTVQYETENKRKEKKTLSWFEFWSLFRKWRRKLKRLWNNFWKKNTQVCLDLQDNQDARSYLFNCLSAFWWHHFAHYKKDFIKLYLSVLRRFFYLCTWFWGMISFVHKYQGSVLKPCSTCNLIPFLTRKRQRIRKIFLLWTSLSNIKTFWNTLPIVHDFSLPTYPSFPYPLSFTEIHKHRNSININAISKIFRDCGCVQESSRKK